MQRIKQQVDAFLKDFKQKSKIWGIVFRDDRGKNAQTLLDLELRPIDRSRIIEKLEVKDYIEGPVHDKLNKGPEMWVFGKRVKQCAVYIEITLGNPNASTICISFHVAEHTISYPLKD